ncbi:uncharacterized protein BO88DRAFT_418774 [Aspergillus vadensis CBS 113365]|uniref:Uncharacterized protein n=1 Tax=Aspergillus vadensis (strain CBS 113365 / IMI 142717 / IBT 24658) TaxID=1448311 RepID=A0A319AY69_ASPVC|nr:hypothetical protein BO88DRAFT_418774 [Aspergillus vadensis CBS 113365]PYH65267.1 hypothetical protein BO88DRAFT_418774 [Aspergillus vadensis CBS 113365]
MAMDKDRNQPRLLPHGEKVAKTASNGPRWQATNDSGSRKILDPTKRGLAYATSEAAPKSIHRPSALRIPDRLLIPPSFPLPLTKVGLCARSLAVPWPGIHGTWYICY